MTTHATVATATSTTGSSMMHSTTGRYCPSPRTRRSFPGTSSLLPCNTGPSGIAIRSQNECTSCQRCFSSNSCRLQLSPCAGRISYNMNQIHRRNDWDLEGYCHRRRSSRQHFSTSSPLSFTAATPTNDSNISSSTTSSFRLDEDGIVWKKNNTKKAKNEKAVYQVIVGLEVHAQLDIPTKLFSSARGQSSTTAGTTNFVSRPNTNVHPYDVAVPGYLPTISSSAVKAAILAAAALNCTIPNVSRFERKHYAYADLPSGYQITQQRWPLAKHGSLAFTDDMSSTSKNTKSRKNKQKQQHETQSNLKCRIQRIQLEQDTGKTIVSGNDSYVDFDRAGCALIEIVTEPDLRSPTQASSLASALRNLLQHIGVCKGKMQDGQLRVDANVNLQRIYDNDDDGDDNDKSTQQQQQAQQQWRTPRVEVKNLNSIQQVAAATTYEAIRQAALYDIKDSVTTNYIPKLGPEETRTWNASTNRTVLIRRKDQEDDYRFLPEPDLPPLVVHEYLKTMGYATGNEMDDTSDTENKYHTVLKHFLGENLPEKPERIAERLQEQYGLTDAQASVLIRSDPAALRLLEEVLVKISSSSSTVSEDSKAIQQMSKVAYNLLVNDLFALVNEAALSSVSEQGNQQQQEPSLADYDYVTADQLAILTQMVVVESSISNTMAKKLLKILFTTMEEEHHQKQQDSSRHKEAVDPRQLALEHNLVLISDADKLREICLDVIPHYPEELDKYRRENGKYANKMLKFFTGQVMKACDYNAHPERLQEILLGILEQQQHPLPQ